MRRLVPPGLAAVAVGYLWQTFAIPLDPWSTADPINARTLPLIYGVTLLAIAVGLTLRPPPVDVDSPPTTRKRWRELASHAAAIIGFGVLIPWAGLWISLAALLVAGLLIAGERRPSVLAIAPLAIAGVAWLLIAVALDVYIDPGRWFS